MTDPLTQPGMVEAQECDLCGDSGYIETVSGGIWTGKNITTARIFCDCACGDDARDQENGTGLHAALSEQRGA
jgi:hypothetical protein